jgi:pilus assembly protein CpaB
MVSSRALSKRSGTILIAVVLAVATGLLAFNYLSSVKTAAVVVPARTVVVASQDIPVRTVITAAMLTQVSRPADAVDPDALVAPSAAVGQIALIAIPSGSTIGASKIGHVGLGGLSVQIPSGEEAIAIGLDRIKGVADLVRAGDHVDVIAVTPAHGTSLPLAATILRNKLVLAMGSAVETPVAAQPNVASSPAPDQTVETATLALTPSEAKLIALADLNATLRLALRSSKDVRTQGIADAFTIAPAAEPVAAPRSAPAASAAPAVRAEPRPAAAVPPGPPIIDGDHYVTAK